MPGPLQAPAILEPLPPSNNQSGGADAGQIKTVTFASPSQPDNNSQVQEMPNTLIGGGASEEDDFNLMPLNFKPRAPATQDQLTGGGVSQDINFPQLSNNNQAGGAYPPAQDNKALGVETKQINISGTERELSEMGVANVQPSTI